MNHGKQSALHVRDRKTPYVRPVRADAKNIIYPGYKECVHITQGGAHEPKRPSNGRKAGLPAYFL